MWRNAYTPKSKGENFPSLMCSRRPLRSAVKLSKSALFRISPLGQRCGIWKQGRASLRCRCIVTIFETRAGGWFWLIRKGSRGSEPVVAALHAIANFNAVRNLPTFFAKGMNRSAILQRHAGQDWSGCPLRIRRMQQVKDPIFLGVRCHRIDLYCEAECCLSQELK